MPFNHDKLRLELQQVIEAKGVTFRDVAQACGLTAATLSRFLAGRDGDLETVDKLCFWMQRPLSAYQDWHPDARTRAESELSTLLSNLGMTLESRKAALALLKPHFRAVPSPKRLVPAPVQSVEQCQVTPKSEYPPELERYLAEHGEDEG